MYILRTLRTEKGKFHDPPANLFSRTPRLPGEKNVRSVYCYRSVLAQPSPFPGIVFAEPSAHWDWCCKPCVAEVDRV